MLKFKIKEHCLHAPLLSKLLKILCALRIFTRYLKKYLSSILFLFDTDCQSHLYLIALIICYLSCILVFCFFMLYSLVDHNIQWKLNNFCTTDKFICYLFLPFSCNVCSLDCIFIYLFFYIIFVKY